MQMMMLTAWAAFKQAIAVNRDLLMDRRGQLDPAFINRKLATEQFNARWHDMLQGNTSSCAADGTVGLRAAARPAGSFKTRLHPPNLAQNNFTQDSLKRFS